MLFFLSSYGPTETTVDISVYDVTYEDEILIGKIYHSLTYHIVDPTTLEPVAEGEQGELIVSGNSNKKYFFL